MNNLVIMHDQQAVTTSLKVAEVFGKRHDHVVRDIEALRGDVPNFGEMFTVTTVPDTYNRPRRAYLMNRDGFTLLAMGYTGKQAMRFKVAYVQAFNSMEQQIQTGYTIPGSYAEALKLAAQQAEQIEQQRPKVLFADAVSTSRSTVLVGELAKILRQNGIDIGQNRLFVWLRERGYLINRQGSDRNMPTQRAMDLGLFRIKESSHVNGDGVVVTTKTPKVTGKGQQYFINKFLTDVGGKE
ncbi:phage regulatory protein/antirepressor Ant [Schleiferilactobacillus harbinensis]|uniref:Rha family transcriptional regulator n=1 Tax=Schleiferilactobacillus harbinensis TaxID=304207 RepID=UPI001AAED0F3|nr:phage regulatory protein/antirepressor Ant [Schleiferilactobacillus harbinensis]MBO3090842.1 phage regulatory protein/antirepressor Ant [Schleiferilactobacillus harbinensis]